MEQEKHVVFLGDGCDGALLPVSIGHSWGSAASHGGTGWEIPEGQASSSSDTEGQRRGRVQFKFRAALKLESPSGTPEPRRQGLTHLFCFLSFWVEEKSDTVLECGVIWTIGAA